MKQALNISHQLYQFQISLFK